MKLFHTKLALLRQSLFRKPRRLFLCTFTLCCLTATTGRADTKVTVQKTPNDGLQPQAVVDAKGTLHLIYYKGEPGAGNLFYVRRTGYPAGKASFSDPIRVNSQGGSAIAAGTIRGGQIALGKEGRVHVAWNGSGKMKGDHAKGEQAKGDRGVPMLYARINDAGDAFEEQRNLMQHTMVLDGGGTVAADSAGNVYVAWHGLEVGGDRGEQNRQVWVARSEDDGKTFSREAPAWTEATGVCACCSTRAFADSRGSVYLLYRSANDGVNRDMYLLFSKDQGKSFQGSLLHRWKVPG